MGSSYKLRKILSIMTLILIIGTMVIPKQNFAQYNIELGLFTNKCSSCHGLDATGGVVGRDIRKRADDPNTITNAIRHVKEMKFLIYLTRTEKGEIADYIAGLPKDSDNYLQGYKEDDDNGEAIFRKACVACHSLNGGSPRVSDLANWNDTYSARGLAGFLVNPPAMIGRIKIAVKIDWLQPVA